MKWQWQQEALKHDRVLIRGARQSGKTITAVNWARQVTGDVLFVVENRMAVNVIMNLLTSIQEEHPIDAVYKKNGKIVYSDGKIIQVVSISNISQARGMRMQAVVLDGVGNMPEFEVMTALATAAHTRNFKLFATYSSKTKNGLKTIKAVEGVAYVHHITVDYLDLLESGAMRASAIRNIKGNVSPKVFAEEFGPYDKDQKKVKYRNINFKHLLSKS